MKTIRLVTAPTAQAVSLSEALAHLRVDGADDNALINSLISASTDALSYLNRTILPSTLALDLDAFEDEIALPRPPLVAVSSILYKDAGNVAQTLASDVYDVVTDSAGLGFVRLAYGKNWPDVRDGGLPITITFTAGYSAVPQAIKAAILLRVGRLYEMRDAASLTPRLRAEENVGINRFEYAVSAASASEAISEAEQHLLAPYRIWTS